MSSLIPSLLWVLLAGLLFGLGSVVGSTVGYALFLRRWRHTTEQLKTALAELRNAFPGGKAKYEIQFVLSGPEPAAAKYPMPCNALVSDGPKGAS